MINTVKRSGATYTRRRTPARLREEAVAVDSETTQVTFVESYTAELVSAGYAEHATILKSAAVEDFIPASIESASALTASKAIPVPMMEIYSGGIEHGEVEMKTCEVFSISEELKLDAVSVLSVQPSPDNLLDEIPVPVIPLLDIPNHSLAFPRFMSPFFNDGPVERLSSTDTTATINPDSDTSFVQQRLEKELKSSVGWKRIVPPEVVMPAPVVDIDLVIEVVEPEEDVQTDFQIRNFPKPLQPNDERITWLHDMVRTAIDCHILNPGGALAAFAQIHSDIDAMRISTPANSIGASKTLNALWMISRACESLGRRVPDAPTAELLTWDLYVEFSKIRKALKDFGISRERPSGTVEEIAGLEIGGIPAWYRFQEMARGLEKLIGSVRGFADWLGWQKPDIKAPMKDLIREQQRIERILRGDPEDVEQEIGLTPWQPTRWQMLVFRLKLSIRKLKEKRAAKAAAKAAARAKKNKRL